MGPKTLPVSDNLMFFLLFLLFCISFNESTSFLWTGKKFNIEGSDVAQKFRFISSREFLLPLDTNSYSNGDKARKVPVNIIVFSFTFNVIKIIN